MRVHSERWLTRLAFGLSAQLPGEPEEALFVIEKMLEIETRFIARENAERANIYRFPVFDGNGNRGEVSGNSPSLVANPTDKPSVRPR